MRGRQAMKHPTNRAERRSVRNNVIARRKFIHLNIWTSHQGFTEWGRYSKFNLNCGCKMCHCLKYGKDKRKRRRALDQTIVDNLKSFE